MICEDCRTANPDVAKFCFGCGSRFAAAPSRRLAERRPMHVVFCDMVGSTPLSAQLDPEELRELLQHFQILCHEVVTRYEGYIAQFLGDGVLVYFGYPRAHEDDAQRAVQAGLEIVRAVSRGSVGGHRVRVRVGIHSGVVVVGEVGVPGRRSELAIGETPNVAARVQAEACPDTVVITDATERLVHGFFATEELGPRSLRGLKQTVSLFTVTGESGARNRLEAAAGLTRFVGRVEETGALLRRWEEIREGRGQVVAIIGEAGVGKSRLVQALKGRLAEHGGDVLECVCSEYLRNSAFFPIVEALSRKIDLAGVSSAEQRLARLESYAERLGLPHSLAANLLADILSITDRVEASEDLSPNKRRQLTIETLSNWLLGLDDGQCRLLIIEDLHWADASTLEVIEGLASRLRGSHVLLLVTSRPGFSLPSSIEQMATTIRLRPLSPEDAALMASLVAGGMSLPDEISDRIEEWTRGVPLYIEEFTKGLLESAVLTPKDGGRLALSGPLPKSLVPDTLAGPLVARIDRLGAAKAVVQLAAVLGVEVRCEILSAVSGLSERALEEALERLFSAELLVRSSSHPEFVFHFKHALIRDAAYNSLLLADRRDIHGRVVSAILDKFKDFAETRPEIVAYHAGEAGLAELSVTEWGRASEKALARAANSEALAHIAEGLRLLGRLAPGAQRNERELAFELARGPALMAVKGFAAPEVREIYRRAHDLCERLGDPSRLYSVLWGLWAHQFVAGELVPALDFAEQVFRIAEATGDPALLVPAYHAQGYTLFYMAEFEQSLKLARLGIELFDLERERKNTRLFQFSSTVALHHFAANSLWMLGFPDQARKHAQRAIETGKLLGHPPSLAYAKSALTGGVPLLAGEPEAVSAAAQEALDLPEDESSLWPPLVRTFRGWSVAAAGDVGSGLAQMRENFAGYRSIGGGILRTTVGALMAEATWKCGDARGALDLISRTLADVESTKEHCYEPELHRIRAEVLASSESSSTDAEASFRSALALAHQQGAKSLELRAATAFARFLGNRGRSEEGLPKLRALYDSFTEGFDTPGLRAARALLT